MEDEELEEKIEEIVIEKIGEQYCSINQRFSIVQQIYSSIRGFTEEGLKQTELTIPKECTALKCTTFDNCTKLEKVYFEGDDTEVGAYCFMDCETLKYVQLPSNLKEIPVAAFSDCSSLETCVMPENITAIQEGAFERCSSLENIDIPENVTTIGRHAFHGCKKLTTVSLKDTKVETIGEFAFEYCDTLTTTSTINAFADLYQKIGEAGEFIDTSSAEAELASVQAIITNYMDDIKTIYNNTAALVESVNGVKSSVSELPEALETLQTKCNEASGALEAVKESFTTVSGASDTGSAGEGEANISEVSNDATSVYETILNEISSAISSAEEALKEETIDGLKNAADSCIRDLEESLGIDVTKRWNLEEYYKLPLSDEAKEDIKDILSECPSAWTEGSYDAVVQTIKEKYIPSVLEMDFSEINGVITRAIDTATGSFVEKMQDSVGEILTTLVETIKGLFDLDVFYDGGLNAYLDDATVNTLLASDGYRGEETDNPYTNLLTAISSMISAVNNFTNAIATADFFSLIDGVKSLINSIKATVSSVVNLTANTVEKITELVGYVRNGEMDKFAELMLMAGYMTHNLPNRTMAGKNEITVDGGGISYATTLEGETLTGFSFGNILTPAKVFSPGVTEGRGESSISAIVDFMNDSLGGGTDQMFRGAELEYVLAGTQSELMNQSVVFMQVYFLRLLLDLVPVFTDPAVKVMASAATIACWAVYLIEVFAEPLCDTVLLVNGSENVNFVKKSCYLTATGIMNLAEELTSVVSNNRAIQESAVNTFKSSIEGKLDRYRDETLTFQNGIMPMDYTTHCLLILMFTTTTDDMLRRLANIVQLEANYYYTQNDAGYTFDIEKAYSGISSSVEIEFESFFKILQINEAEDSLIKKQYTRTQCY